MLTSSVQQFLSIRSKLIGSPESQSLESRIFHTFSLFIFIVLVCEAFINLSLGLYVSSALTLAILLIQIVLYYLSRFKGKLQVAVVISFVEAHILTAIGYFYNAGIAGASLLLFAECLFVLLSISTRKQWPWWFGFNLVIVLSIVGYEYFVPSSIQQTYNSRAELFIDNIASYLVTVILLLIGTATIRNSYNRQKELADENMLALELLNAEKVKLFSIISHDLRTPLASVQQYFTVMTQIDLGAAERVELEKNLLTTISSTQDLLTNLLKWAKHQMDGATVHLKPINVNDFLTDTVILFETIALKKDITLISNLDENISVLADADMLQLIVRNLLNNAVKFTPPAGQIEMSTSVADFNCTVAIRDNGSGIPLTQQADIFSLSLISSNGTQNEEGTGLGLVLCKDYTELQGGKIWFESTAGVGTTFYVSLPLSR